ncbi:hypothetical protein [Rhodovibrio sodomensis]|uniref:hypothetical protein n=1 Tax=Rhodovibrio sodomensis TaxID=1088 RepID=UPI001904D165|nr:hypothetical protein [Rhodovibrio sodomensis]
MTVDRESLLKTYSNLSLHSANEAETRLKVIDQIFFGLLGWTYDDVTVEERIDHDGRNVYADYIFRTGRTAFVVEAKKVGDTFGDVPNLRRTNLRGKILQGLLGETIKQARDYAVQQSIPFSLVTNGSSWIIFPGHRVDQIPLSQSSAIIFPSLQTVLGDGFDEFYDLLARENVINGSLENDLLGRIEDQYHQRRLNQFYHRPFHKIHRQNLFHLIEDAITTAFNEDSILSDESLLEKCYVSTPERTRFDRRINMHISKRQPVLPKAPARPLRESTEGKKGRRREGYVGDAIEKASQRARPLAMLVLGTVGAGKTTFIHYSRRISAAQKFVPPKDEPYPHWIYVDGRELALDEKPTDFIFHKIFEYMQSDSYFSDWHKCIRPAYKDKIESLLKGPLFLLSQNEDEANKKITEMILTEYHEVQPYVERLLAQAVKNAPVFLVVDNIDQFERDEFQSQIFSDTMAIAQRNHMNLMLSLREKTYVRNRNLPIFDAFDFDPIYIDPPVVSSVLSKRFLLARELLKGESGEFTSESGIKFELDDLSVVIDLVQTSVLGTEVGNLIDILATSDIRLALRMTREFLQFGYTATGKALDIYQRTGKYVMPQHEALRAIMLGNRSIYSEEYSVIGNPFDAKLSQTKAQLLRLFVLAGCVNEGGKGSVQSVDGERISQIFDEMGFGETICLHVLRDLCWLRFLQTAGQTEVSLEASFIPTRLGGYIARELIANIMYLENVMMDTFIPDEDVWTELRDLTDKIYDERDILARFNIRKERTRRFFEYMKEMYRPLEEEARRRGISTDWCSNPISDAKSKFDENQRRATRSALRNYGDNDQERRRKKGRD